jgi:iron complex transport system substrate-binding protein
MLSGTFGAMKTWWSCALITVLLAACGEEQHRSVGTWDEWTALPNAYASNFKIWERGEDRLVIVFGHGGEQDTVGKYWLTRAKSDEPLPIAARRIALPMRRVAMISTTHVPFVSALGKTDAIVAQAHLDQVRDSSLIRSMHAGQVQEIAMGDGVDREKLLTLKLDALFTYPFGQTGMGSIEKLGIPVIEVNEYREEHPLGRAEWLRFFGTLFGEEQQADSLFAGIRSRYEAIRVNTTDNVRPTVLFGSVWDGQWWVPPGNSYMARLIEDAGGKYLFTDRKGTGNIAVDMETMISMGSNVDVWGMIASIEGEPGERDFTNGDERLMSFKAVKRNQLFMANAARDDIFGQAVIEPHTVLLDLKSCIQPDLVDPSAVNAPKYFARVYRVPPRYVEPPRVPHDI